MHQRKVTWEQGQLRALASITLLRNFISTTVQCLSQDLETGCLKLAVVKFLGVQMFKGDHNILIFQP